MMLQRTREVKRQKPDQDPAQPIVRRLERIRQSLVRRNQIGQREQPEDVDRKIRRL